MKKVFVLLLALIAAFMFSACSKNDYRSLLIGTWEVSIELRTSSLAYRDGVWNFTFSKGGKGKMVKVRDESKSYDFTYKYHKDNSTITYEVNGSPYVWEVDELTNDTFRFHSNNDATDYLFGYSSSSGVKIVFDGKATEEN